MLAPCSYAKTSSYEFGLRHLFWLIAVYIAAIASFGFIGVFTATWICLAWACAVSSNDIRLAYGIIGVTTIGVVIPASTSRIHYCSIAATASPHYFGEVVRAVRQYHLDHGALPPTSFKGSDGESIHSWRVLLLPYLDCGDIYPAYRFDEPWDGPNHRLLHSQCPLEYRNWREDDDGSTGVVAIIGGNTAWQANAGADDPEFARKVLFIEAAESIPWLAPRDEAFDAQRLARQKPIPSLSGSTCSGQELLFRKTRGRHIGLFNGSSLTTKSCVDADTSTRLVDVNSPSPDPSLYAGHILGEWKLHTPTICRLSMLLFISTILLALMWRKTPTPDDK